MEQYSKVLPIRVHKYATAHSFNSEFDERSLPVARYVCSMMTVLTFVHNIVKTVFIP